MVTKTNASKSREKLGERLKEFRKALKMNQKALAEVLQIEQALISMVENSKTELAYWHIRKLREVYNLNGDWLEYGEGDMFLSKPADGMLAEPEASYTPKFTKRRTDRVMEVVDKLLADEQIGNYEEFCLKNDLGANYLYEFQGGRIKDPNKLMYDTLYRKYRVNLGYVFYDDPDMFSNSASDVRVLSIVVDKANNEIIKAVPVYAQAGYQKGFADPEFIEGLPDYDFYNDDEGTYRVFELKGDSMYPYLLEGDFVKAKFLPPVHWRDKLRLHEVFVVVTRDGVVCKQLAGHDPAQGTIRLHSFNDLYDDYTLNLTDVYELWYYKGFYSRRTFRDVR
ncbi:hypothetical protein BH09BAC1_BH09BAC1_19540 [soil metagenome]